MLPDTHVLMPTSNVSRGLSGTLIVEVGRVEVGLCGAANGRGRVDVSIDRRTGLRKTLLSHWPDWEAHGCSQHNGVSLPKHMAFKPQSRPTWRSSTVSSLICSLAKLSSDVRKFMSPIILTATS